MTMLSRLQRMPRSSLGVLLTLLIVASACAPAASPAPTAPPAVKPTEAPKPAATTPPAAAGATTAPAATTATDAPKPAAPAASGGGELVLSQYEDAETLDPTLGGTAGGRLIFTQMCEKLYDLDAKGAVVPQLATALPEVSADGLTVTIKLRAGVKFNDGTPMDAQSVKISLDRHRTLQGSRRAAELSAVKDVAVVDPTTVRLTLAQPSSPLLATLADRAGMILSPAQLDKMGDKFGTNPVCVGPFSFVERTPGDRTVLQKAKDYYDADQVKLDRVVFQFIPDDTVRMSNLRSGDILIADRVPTTDVAAMQNDPNFKVTKVTTNGYNALTINISNIGGIGTPAGTPDSALAGDPRLREAFELSLDRAQINQIVFNGLQEPGCSPISPASPFAPADLKCPGRDIARAKELIAQAGVSMPIPVELQINQGTVNQRFAELVQAMAKDVGFAVTVRPLDNTTSLANMTKGQFQVAFSPWSGRVDPDGNIYSFHYTKGPDNNANVSDPKLDELLDRARAESSLEARKKLYADAIAIIRERRSNIYLWFSNVFTAASSRVSGYEMYVDGMPRLKNVSLSPGG
jgi:peptide/nickel transport system substrate-binding protein